MEQQLAHLLSETQNSQAEPRKRAELELKQLYHNPQFAPGLASLAATTDVPVNIRQAALLVLRKFVDSSWSPSLEDFAGEVLVSDESKHRLRETLYNLATSEDDERKIKSAASLVVSKIALADFPDEWPELLPTLLQMIPEASDGRLHGALKVLQDLVDDCLGEDQFFQVARELITSLYNVATRESRRPTLRALAISVFRSSFDTLEMVLEAHKSAVKGFAEETLQSWNPFLLSVIKTPVPPTPDANDAHADKAAVEYARGVVALKLQVIKALLRIRVVFPSVLAPQSLNFFSAVWEELSTLQASYEGMYLVDELQGRLIDADGLPYTLDFLVVEELDFLHTFLRAPPVRKELSKSTSWINDIVKLASTYAQITKEEEGFWEVDVNIFLSEESSVTANYTPRTACTELMVKLGEWTHDGTVKAVLHGLTAAASAHLDWRSTEAMLFLLNATLRGMQDLEKPLQPEDALGFVDFVTASIQHEQAFLRARGHLVAGSLVKNSGQTLHHLAPSFMQSCLHAMVADESTVVQVSCVRALQQYLSAVPSSSTNPLQAAIISSLSQFLSLQDIDDLAESDDVVTALLETLRDAILLDPRICLQGVGLDLLFSIANSGASNFQLAMLITETFESVTSVISESGPEAFGQLCSRILPSLNGVFDAAQLTEENPLTTLAADMLSVLTEKAPSPLPEGFAETVLPRLVRVLLESNEDELLRSCTSATRYIVEHDPEQTFSWRYSDGKSGLEILLVVIDRLLNGGLDDHAASEVGGLAGALVEKAGSEKLGPYLPQLLNAVAVRATRAEKTQLIQSLILVFARLMPISASEVVDFLNGVQIGSVTGLQAVVTKWLEHSVHFTGYDEIRQNVVALTRLYDLHTPHLPTIIVRGDQIVQPNSTRIITRSRAKQQPITFTQIPADLKIIKLLTSELLDPSANDPAALARRAANGLSGDAANDDEDDDDENIDGDGDDDDADWEDEPAGASSGFLDLGAGLTRESLMRFGADDNEGRGADFERGGGVDDETQAFLLEWFRGQAGRPGFGEVFERLNGVEQERLRKWLS